MEDAFFSLRMAPATRTPWTTPRERMTMRRERARRVRDERRLLRRSPHAQRAHCRGDPPSVFAACSSARRRLPGSIEGAEGSWSPPPVSSARARIFVMRIARRASVFAERGEVGRAGRAGPPRALVMMRARGASRAGPPPEAPRDEVARREARATVRGARRARAARVVRRGAASTSRGSIWLEPVRH